MSSLMLDGQLEIMRQIEMINIVYLANDDSMEFICNPFEFLPLCVDPMNFSSNAGFFEPTGTGSPLRGRLVMNLINLPVIAIG